MKQPKRHVRNIHAAVLACLLGVLPAPPARAAITASIPSTGDPAADKAIDDEAHDRAAEYAAAGMKLDAELEKKALEKEEIGNVDSVPAKRFIAKFNAEYSQLIDGKLTMQGINPNGPLGKRIKQQALAMDAEQKANKQAAQTLKEEAAAKTKEAEQAAAAKTTDAAEKQLVAKALTAAATTLAQNAAPSTPADASTPAGATDEAPPPTGQGAAASKTVKSDTSVVSGAKIQVADSLKLVTTNLFAGRAYLWGRPWSLEVTSSLPASTVNPAASTTYSNAELQLPDGGILNIRIGLISNLLNLPEAKRQKYFEAGSKIPIYGDRASEFDRYYFFGGHSITVEGKSYNEISVGDALVYFRDGLDFKGIYRPTLTPAAGTAPAGNTPSTKTGDYGVGAGYYAALGFDGGLFSQKQTLAGDDSGNFRLEAMFTGQFTDRKSLNALFPNAGKTSSLSYAAGGRFVIVLTNHLNLDVQTLWPFGSSRSYMKPTLIGGFSLTR